MFCTVVFKKKAIKCYGDVEVYLDTLFNLASHGDEWSASFGSVRRRKEPPIFNELDTGWVPDVFGLFGSETCFTFFGN